MLLEVGRNDMPKQAIAILMTLLFLGQVVLGQETEDWVFPLVATGFVPREQFLPGNIDAPHFNASFTFTNVSNTTYQGELRIFQDDGTFVTEGGFLYHMARGAE
jgi:hypothetical protein